MNNRPYKQTLAGVDFLYIEDISQPNITQQPRKISLDILKQKIGGGFTVPGTNNEIAVAVGGVASTNDELQNIASSVFFDGQYYSAQSTSFRMKIFKESKLLSDSGTTFTLHTLVAGQTVYVRSYVFCVQSANDFYVWNLSEASFDRISTSRMQGTQSVLHTGGTGTFSHNLSGNDIRMTISGLANTNQWQFRIFSQLNFSHA